MARSARRIVAAAVGTAMAAGALVACSSGDGGGGEIVYSDFAPTAENEAAFEAFADELDGKWEGKTLRIMGVKDPWLPAFQTMMTEFEALTGAKLTFENYSYDDTFSKEMLVGQQKSDEVDIIMFDLPWVGRFAETGFVEPLDERIDAADPDLLMYDDFYEVMREGSVWDDKTLGIPFAPYFVMQISNSALLDEAGVEAPKTLEEFVSTCEEITEATGIAGTAINNQSGTPVGQAYFDWIYSVGGKPFASEHPGADGDYYADMTPQFSSPESKQVLEMFKHLMETCEPDGAANIAWQERYSAFATSQAAMIHPWNYDIPPLDDPEQSAVAGSYEVSPMPVADGVDAHTPVGGWEMGINTYSEQKDMAWDFIQWFSSPAVNGAFLSEGGFASRYSVGENEQLLEQYPWLEVQQDVVDDAFPAFRPQVPESFEIMNTLGDHIGAYLAGEKTLDEATADADESIGGMLADAGYKVDQ
ncbi:MAG: ABC transporter substrate-binding protein [Microbacterium sp.]